MRTAYQGISKVLLAKKTGTTYTTPIVIDGVTNEDNGVGQLVVNLTQNKTKIASGMIPNASELRSPMTGTGTLTLTFVDRETRQALLDGIENGNGGISEGSMFGERTHYGLTIMQEDGGLIVGKVYYDVVLSSASTDTFNSVSADAPEETSLVLNLELYPIITRKAGGTLQDYVYTDFNSVDDATNITTLTTTIAIPTEQTEEL